MDEEASGETKQVPKTRKELPEGAVAILKAWLLSPEHFAHPYPTPEEQIRLMQQTGIDKKQLKNWFTNARRRIWKPMLNKQVEQGKLATAGAVASGEVVAMPPGGSVGATAAATAAAAVVFAQQPQPSMGASTGNVGGEAPYLMAPTDGTAQALQLQPFGAYGNPMDQTTGNIDSHAVLMELFARDQALVRQAVEDAKLKARAAAANEGSI